MDTLLQSIVQYSPTGLVLFEVCRDTDGRIVGFQYVLTNQVSSLVASRRVEDVTKGTLIELSPAIAKDEFYDRLVAVAETGESQYYQHFFRGDSMEAWINATLVRVDNGVLGSFQNVTALMRQNLELELARKAAEEAHRVAEQALQIRDVFLANISHEIRTPLNSILGFSELLAEELTDPEQLAYAANIKGAGHTLLKLINNILDLAKLDANQLELERQPTSLTEVVGSVANILSARAKQKNVRFTYQGEDVFPPVVLSDGLRLTQILMNLGENAVKFTKEGHIDLLVTLEDKTSDEVIISFQLTDTGIGVSAHRLPLIFDRYQQTSAEITRSYGGTGLGLSIVQSLVQRMGGDINVVSELGKGTTFTVQLPFALPDIVSAPLAAPLTPVEMSLPGHPVTVLLVEDNPYNQRVVESLVQRFDVALLKANNGLEALSVLLRQTVDLVLMDLQMPLMDGYTTTRHIRQTLGLTVPIVALTANALTHERENCLRRGMSDYLTKPFTRQELMLMISQYSQPRPNQPSFVSPVFTVRQLDKTVLEDLYDTEWSLLESQYDMFETEWPHQCQLLSESLINRQTVLFNQYAHKFCSTLDALGMIHAATNLKELSRQFDSSTSAERSQRMNQLIDDVEQAIVELKEHIEQGQLLAE